MVCDATLEAIESAGAEQTDRLGYLTDAVVHGLRHDDIARAFVPTELGGPERQPDDVLADLIDLGAADASVGWCAMVSVTMSLTSGFMEPTQAEQVFGSEGSIAVGVAAPSGTAIERDGGLEVTGRWAWASASAHADWIGLGTRLVDANGQPTARRDGVVAPFVVLPITDVVLGHDWDALGLRATGSGTVTADARHAPEGRWVQLGAPPLIDRGVYRLPFFGLLALGVASVVVGIATAARRDFIDIAGTKVSLGSSRPLSGASVIQAALGEASSTIRTARAAILHEVNRVQSAAKGGPVSADDIVAVREVATDAAQGCADAVTTLYRAASGSSVHQSSPLNRHLRDAMTARQHAMVGPTTMTTAGRHALGTQPDLSLF